MQDYETLLQLTESAGSKVAAPETNEEAAALGRFKEFFSNMTPDRVRNQVDSVYDKDAYLYDTLALHHGIDAIRPYFIRTAERADGVTVEILDTIRKGNDFYVKWSMDITWSAFKKGKTTRSFGISHIRFGETGKVVLHYDFWDSTNGFFEHLPIIGGLIRWVKRRV